jgi:predicted lipoprotein
MVVGPVTLTGMVAASNHGEVQVGDGSVDAQANHNWTISPRQSGTVDAIELNYSRTGVDVSGVSSASDVGVLVNGSAMPVDQVQYTFDVARFFFRRDRT